MPQITTRLPDDVAAALDTAAQALRRPRAEIVRLAIERYLEDFGDLTVAVERLRDPSDAVLDWEGVRDALLRQD
jgi:predicted DNA-binding protein